MVDVHFLRLGICTRNQRLRILTDAFVICSLAITVVPYCAPVQYDPYGEFARVVECMTSGLLYLQS